jgi:eukaryotic-like serine/threonine-protein kinase
MMKQKVVTMRSKPFTLVILFVALGSLLSACSGSAFVPSGWAGLSVDNEVAYLAHNQYVYAINITNGTQIWQYPDRGQAGKTFFAPPVISSQGDQILVGSYDTNLYSIGLQIPQENWAFDTNGHLIDAPLVVGENIYVPSGDSILYALDASRNVRWRFQARNSLWARPAASPDGSTIYLSSLDHHVYALNSETGNVVWSQDLGGAVVGTPTVSEDGSTIYVGSFGQNMYALNAQNGQILWSSPTNDWVWSGPALYEGRLYFGDLGGIIYALDASNGSILWQQQPDGPVASTPLVTEEGVFVGNESGSLVAYDLQGTPLWTQNIGGKIYTSPVDAGELILVAPIETDFRLVALTKNGVQRWIFTP